MADDSVDALSMLRQSAALLDGHFLLSSGLHSGQYVQCAQLFQYPDRTERVARSLAQHAPAADVVVSPALGGVLLGHEVARALKLRHVFCERDEGRFVLRRGFRLKAQERVIVVEDVFTTGKSTREVMEVVSEHGARVVGCLSLVFRGPAELNFGVETYSLVRLPLDTHPAAECPLCKEGLPVVKPGSRPAAGAPMFAGHG